MTTPGSNKMNVANAISANNAINPSKKALEEKIAEVCRNAKTTGTYPAALLATVCFVPIGAAFVSIITYIALFQLLKSSQPWWSIWVASLGGTLFTGGCWLLIALRYKRFTAVDCADIINYERLINRLHQIAAWFDIIKPHQGQNGQVNPAAANNPCPKTNSDEDKILLKQASVKEVQESFDVVCERLQTPSISWIVGFGYNNVWRLLHYIDEALVAFEPLEEVIYDALHDHASFQGSSIKQEDVLRHQLVSAAKMIDPQAEEYFFSQCSSPEKSIAKTNPSASQTTGVPPDGGGGSTQPKSDNHPPESRPLKSILLLGLPGKPKSDNHPHEASHHSEEPFVDSNRARCIIHYTRHRINEYRDEQWENLMHTRHLLMKMSFCTGLVLYALTEFAILCQVLVNILTAITGFYLVGGLIAFFSTLYNQSRVDTSLNDYRLANARLIATPVYAGIAAVFGVLLVATLSYGVGHGSPSPSQALVFTINNLLIAAAFALTPSLVPTAIQRRIDQYRSNLESTEPHAGQQEKSS